MPNDVNVRTLSLTYVDWTREKSTTSINAAEFTDNAAYVAARDALIGAITPVVFGVQTAQSEALETRLSNDLPGSQLAQREEKLLIGYSDNVNLKQFVVSVPTLNKSALTFAPNSDFVDMAVAPADALKTAFEGFAVSPYGNAVTVQYMKYVGRNT